MAIATSPDVCNTFLTKSASIRFQIKSNFSRLTQRINTRRNDLLKKLEQYETRYKQLTEESEQAFNKLEDLKHNSKDILSMNLLNSFQTKIHGYIDTEIINLENEIRTMDVTFEWDDTVERLVSDLGLSDPRGICVDRNTSNIYITDRKDEKSSVYVYNTAGEPLLRIGEHDKEMDSPFGIAVHEDKIYVSQSSSHSILKYQYFQSSIPKKTSSLAEMKGFLKNPTFMSIDEYNSHVYVCDTGNKRIVRYTKFLKFHSEVCGKRDSIPVDVKISGNFIFILFIQYGLGYLVSNSFEISLFSKSEGNPFQKSILKRSFSEIQSFNFDIDMNENILVSHSSQKSFVCIIFVEI
ncbi:hypothetical protein LOD99_15653 [Oopsacas minuta]|uniref:Uncharacterized protein n=1 Tax=Oopsacas minuta TaxID=111878 RepID=A0AAV7KAK2_9METZ|nr:hypothetical protein LOD99_15653 [Oopsacas minuta]